MPIEPAHQDSAGLPYNVIGVYDPPTGLFGERRSAPRPFIPYGTLREKRPLLARIGWTLFVVAGGFTVARWTAPLTT